jgi:hypothetical protein
MRRFYHLDTCLCPLASGNLLYFPAAFDEKSRGLIESVRTRPKFHFILGTLNIAAQLGNLADNAARLVIENARQIPIGHAIAEIATIHRAHNQAGTASPNGPPQAGGLTRLSVAAHRPGKASNQTFRVLLVNGAALLRKGNRTAPSWRIAAASGKRKPRRQ